MAQPDVIYCVEVFNNKSKQWEQPDLSSKKIVYLNFINARASAVQIVSNVTMFGTQKQRKQFKIRIVEKVVIDKSIVWSN